MDEINRWSLSIKFIEQGDIYFFYKPKKGVDKVEGVDDVSRFYFIMDSQGSDQPRYIVMGNKKMPAFSDGEQTVWGFVQIVGGRGFETILKETVYRKKNASRPVGEGIYTILNHRDHTHLMYALELPEKLGVVQKAFNIKKEADYIFSNRPVNASPKSFESPYSNFSPANPDYLNKRGTEVLLIGVEADISRLGIAAEKDKETIKSADIFSKLKVDSSRHPTNTLIKGVWE